MGDKRPKGPSTQKMVSTFFVPGYFEAYVSGYWTLGPSGLDLVGEFDSDCDNHGDPSCRDLEPRQGEPTQINRTTWMIGRLRKSA